MFNIPLNNYQGFYQKVLRTAPNLESLVESRLQIELRLEFFR
jgi:hypothetical protein